MRAELDPGRCRTLRQNERAIKDTMNRIKDEANVSRRNLADLRASVCEKADLLATKQKLLATAQAGSAIFRPVNVMAALVEVEIERLKDVIKTLQNRAKTAEIRFTDLTNKKRDFERSLKTNAAEMRALQCVV